MNKKIYFKLKIFFNIGMPRQDCCIKRWEQGQSFFEPRLPVCRVKLVCFFFLPPPFQRSWKTQGEHRCPKQQKFHEHSAISGMI